MMNYIDESDEAWIEKYRAALNEEASKKTWLERLVNTLRNVWSHSAAPVRAPKSLTVLDLKSTTLMNLQAPSEQETAPRRHAA